MLKMVLKDRRTKPVFPVYVSPTYVAPTYSKPAEETTGMWAEVNQRNEIIRSAYVACKFVKGQVVLPVNPQDLEKHGECSIVGICATYAEYGKDCEWPAHNNPFIVTAIDSKGQTLFTTNNYFKSKD